MPTPTYDPHSPDRLRRILTGEPTYHAPAADFQPVLAELEADRGWFRLMEAVDGKMPEGEEGG